LKLKITDFSIEDKKRAEELLNEERFKFHMDQKMKRKHNEITMFEGKVETRSIKDYDYNKTR